MKLIVIPSENKEIISITRLPMSETIFIKKEDKFVGMVLENSNGTWTAATTRGYVSTKFTHYKDRETLIKELVKEGYDCYIELNNE